MMNLLFWTWCLPQSTVGFIVYSFYKMNNKVVKTMTYHYVKVIFIKTKAFTGVSLGKYIILNESEIDNDTTLKHEYGHTKQSIMSGLFYLLIVGIPSIIRNIIWRIKKLPTSDYYKGFPEDWADRLGGVIR
ncbi:MAG: hypothetical protein JXB88_21650 [Spirochaetales bacterium]|nr:hypothetical protein [Spirochaetales bacterium]